MTLTCRKIKPSSEFLNAYNAKDIVKNKNCFKSIDNPFCVDLILTDKPGSFQHTNVFETSISDHLKLVTTVMKTTFTKASPKCVHYCNYKNFNEQDFRLELRGRLEVNVVDANYETFYNVLKVLNKHVPIKTKVIRGNQAPYITKAYRKVVMKRSELKAKYLKKIQHQILRNLGKRNIFEVGFTKREERVA